MITNGKVALYKLLNYADLLDKDIETQKQIFKLAEFIAKELDILDIFLDICKGQMKWSNWIEFDIDYDEKCDPQGTRQRKQLKRWLQNKGK